jgi:hypothetical protein
MQLRNRLLRYRRFLGAKPSRRRSSHANGERGIALLTTLLVIVLAAVVIAAAVEAAMSVTRTASADYFSTRVFYAAEAGAEAALSQIETALQNDGIVDSTELANIVAPVLEGFTFEELTVERDGPQFTETLSDGPFSGMYSLTQNFIITSRVTDAMNTHGAVVLGAKGQAIPIYQFAIFFEGSLEDYAGSRKDHLGRVHTNGDFFLAASDIHFHSLVTTPGEIHRDGMFSHEDELNIGVFIKDKSGNDVLLTFDSDDTPDPDQFKAKSNADFDDRLRTGAYGVDSLKLPLPAGLLPHALVEPRDPGNDGPAERAVKFAWKADMYVTVDLGAHLSKNTVCGGSPPADAPSLLPTITVERPYGGTVPDDVTKCQIFEFRWEQFYDNGHEGWIDVMNIDIADLRNWINGPGDEVQIIYVEFNEAPVTNTSVTDPHNGDGTRNDGIYWPVLRLRNGAQLPGPFTVGSEYPMWIQGDYNTINWQPAAVFTDRIGTMSNTWTDNDAQNDYNNPSLRCKDAGDSNCNRASSDTDQYFAVITGVGEGNVGCFHEDPGCSLPPYGGTGWWRLLENWKTCSGGPESGRCIMKIVGSYVALYAPQHADSMGSGIGGSSYVRPVRDWSFDGRFEFADSLPPGTPVVGQVFRAAFRESY